MGAIADAINSFDKSDAEKEKIKSELDILSELAETRAQLAEAKIVKSLEEGKEGRGLLVPITRVKETAHETHAYAKQGIDQIKDTASKSIEAFLKGGSENIVSGIVDMVAAGVTAFLGGGSGSADQYAKYFIVNEGPLSLLRFDLWGWKREAIGSGIKEKVESVSAFVGFKSVIDFTKLEFPDFVNFYQTQLMESGLPQDNMLAALKQAREIYQVMSGRDVARLEGVQMPALESAVRPEFNRGFNSGFNNLVLD